jgi:hypothetical protein
MMRARSLSPLVLVLVASGFVFGQQDDNKTNVDPSGTWKWERNYNGNKIDYTLRLKWHDSKLTGSYKTDMENGPPGLSEPVEIKDGAIDGDKVSFTVTRKFNENEFVVDYAGRLVGDKLDGNVEFDIRDSTREFPWNAKRIVTRDDVLGKWNIKFEARERTMESSFTLEADGDRLKGTYHSSRRGDQPIKDIELKENKLSFVVTFQNDDREIAVTCKAEPRGDKIAGVILTNFGNQERQTPFAGARAASSPDDGDDDGDKEDDNDEDDDGEDEDKEDA